MYKSYVLERKDRCLISVANIPCLNRESSNSLHGKFVPHTERCIRALFMIVHSFAAAVNVHHDICLQPGVHVQIRVVTKYFDIGIRDEYYTSFFITQETELLCLYQS